MKKIAFIGCNRIFSKHSEAIRRSEIAEISCVSDINPEVLHTVGMQLNVPTYTEYKKMLRENNVDLVVVATPSQLHREHVSYCMAQGRRVLVEKPPTISLSELDALIHQQETDASHVRCVLQLRHSPAYLSAKEIIGHNILGDILGVEMSIRYHRDMSYYNSWIGDTPHGMLLDLGIHYIDYMLGVIGETPVITDSISKSFERVRIPHTYGAHFRFSTGADGYLEISTDSDYDQQLCQLHIRGSKGEMSIGGYALSQIVSISSDDQEINNILRLYKSQSNNSDRDSIDNFVDMYRTVLAGGGVSLTDVRPTMNMINSIIKSL